MNLLVTVIGLCMAGGGYYATARVGQWRGWWAPKYTRRWLLQQFGILWASAIVQLGFVQFVENRPLRSVGFDPVYPVDFVVGVVIGAFVIVVLGALPEGVLQRFGRAVPNEESLYILAQPVRWKVFAAFTVGVTEVVLFFGYFMERVLELTGSPLWAVGLSTVIAARSSLPEMGDIRLARIPVALGHGLALSVLYLAFRNVFVIAGAQTMVSLLGLLGNSAEDALFGREPTEFHDRVAQAIQGG